MVKGCIITHEEELVPGMKVVVVNKKNRNERDTVVVGPDKKIDFKGASIGLTGIGKIGRHLVVAW